MKPRKPKKSEMDKLKSNLHHWQMWGRIYRQDVRAVDDKVREIAAKMRALQQSGND